MNAIGENEFSQGRREMAAKLPKPDAIGNLRLSRNRDGKTEEYSLFWWIS